MKFLHLSDLHLGKRVSEFSMTEEQEYIINQILGIARGEAPSAVVLAGDIYDKPVPTIEAVRLFDRFLSSLVQMGVEVLVISGNHDSAERLSFASSLLGSRGVHISPAFSGEIVPVTLNDGFGAVNFYLLPFIKPLQAARAYADDGIKSYTQAIAAAVAHMNVDFSARNVLVTHQFVTGAERSGSEELSVGGADNVDVGVFDGFDYVALGHIHGPQNVCGQRVRYCGTPLKYSFSEAKQNKSVTIVEIGKKGEMNIRLRELTPRRDWVQLRGTYENLTQKSFVDSQNRENYYKIVLTDEDDIPEGMAKLRYFYPNLMALEYDNARTRAESDLSEGGDVSNKTPFELFGELYEKQNGRPMTDEMNGVIKDLIERIWEGDK